MVIPGSAGVVDEHAEQKECMGSKIFFWFGEHAAIKFMVFVVADVCYFAQLVFADSIICLSDLVFLHLNIIKLILGAKNQ